MFLGLLHLITGLECAPLVSALCRLAAVSQGFDSVGRHFHRDGFNLVFSVLVFSVHLCIQQPLLYLLLGLLFSLLSCDPQSCRASFERAMMNPAL